MVTNYVSYAHLIGPTLSMRNTNTTMRHTALLLGAFAFSVVFCGKRKALC